MKRLIVSLVLFLFLVPLKSQDKIRGFEFSEKLVVKHTPVKDQHRTGTCWSFATVSFLEAEILRISNMELDLSEMFYVRNAYAHKADLYVRFHGTNNFSQ